MPRISNAEYQAMLQRTSRARGELECPVPASGGPSSEAALHSQIKAECARRGWIALTGSMAHKAMRVLGEPDFLILADGGRVYLVEAKTATGKLSTEQQALQVWAKKLGHNIAVVRSMEQFLNLIDNRCESKESGKEIDNR